MLPVAREALEYAEAVLRRSPDHAGAMLLRTLVLAQAPATGSIGPEAIRLTKVAPQAGHAWYAAGLALQRDQAVEEAERYAAEAAAQPRRPYPMLYLEALLQLQVSLGQSEAALRTAGDLTRMAEPRLSGIGLPACEDPPCPESRWEAGCSSERYVVQLLLTQVVFSRWDDLLQVSEPPAPRLYQLAAWHFAKGSALAALGDAEAGKYHLLKLHAAQKRLAAGQGDLGRLPGAALASVFAGLLKSRLAPGGGGDVAALQAAREAYAALPYDEPPALRLPPGLELGEAMLRSGDAAGAQAAFLAELSRTPKLGWALKGLQQACQAHSDAACVLQATSDLEAAWQTADVDLLSAVQTKVRRPRWVMRRLLALGAFLRQWTPLAFLVGVPACVMLGAAACLLWCPQAMRRFDDEGLDVVLDSSLTGFCLACSTCFGICEEPGRRLPGGGYCPILTDSPPPSPDSSD